MGAPTGRSSRSQYRWHPELAPPCPEAHILRASRLVFSPGTIVGCAGQALSSQHNLISVLALARCGQARLEATIAWIGAHSSIDRCSLHPPARPPIVISDTISRDLGARRRHSYSTIMDRLQIIIAYPGRVEDLPFLASLFISLLVYAGYRVWARREGARARGSTPSAELPSEKPRYPRAKERAPGGTLSPPRAFVIVHPLRSSL